MPFVLDASAAMPWFFADEATPATDCLLGQALRRTSLFVPAHWPTEMLSGLTRAVRRGRMDEPGLERFLKLVAQLEISVSSPSISEHWDDLLPLIRRHRLSAYDAAYLSLAKRLAIPLATLDSRLRAAAPLEGVALEI